MSQEANVLQRVPYASLVNGVTCLGGDHRMDGSCYYSQNLLLTASRRGDDL